ncbi:AAA family ATPase [Rhodococcus sp. IEGM 1408]|uniref:AAA family ATPase n=1 Tax=Rhodococcus sp. IEGM 1408 TaxID=3082220 RepID=UPI0029533E46|nr:AAA family ATPase [Rhodococcus sp. IEGM 1408]MDV8000381.1 AAA family ATPase [Rhodococcus sp. IEGM 1408]
MSHNGNAVGAGTPTASNVSRRLQPTVPPAATVDQGPRDLSLTSSTLHADTDEATVLVGRAYTVEQLDQIAEHTGCLVLSTAATAEQIAAGAVPDLGTTLADYDLNVVLAGEFHQAETVVDRITAEVADVTGRPGPEIRGDVQVTRIHPGVDVHARLAMGGAVLDTNGQHVLGPERSTSSTPSTPGDHRSHRERAFAEAKAEKVADLRVRRASREHPPVRHPPLVEDLLDRYTGGYVAGLPGHGKTYVDVALMCAVATGTPFAGRDTYQGVVVFLAGEGEQVTLDRVRAWELANLGEGERIPFSQLMVLPGAEDLRDPSSVAARAMIEVIAEVEPVLVIFDTLNRYTAGADENAASDMSAFVKVADEIRRGPSRPHVSITHHTSKAGADLRGSSVLRGAADVILMCRKVSDGYEVWTDKQRGSGEGPVGKFTLEPVEWTEVVDGETRTVSSARVVWDAFGPGAVGTSPREIVDKVLTGYTGLDESGLDPARQMYVVIRVIAGEDGMTPGEARKYFRQLKNMYNSDAEAATALKDATPALDRARDEKGQATRRWEADPDHPWAKDKVITAAVNKLAHYLQTTTDDAAGGAS